MIGKWGFMVLKEIISFSGARLSVCDILGEVQR